MGNRAHLRQWRVLLPAFLFVIGAHSVQCSDILMLANGERAEGRVLNETFRLRTAYEELSLPARYVASIEFQHSEHRLQTILTVNSNTFSGFLVEPTIKIELQTGSHTEIRRERLEKLILEHKNSTDTLLPANQWVLLRNGDRLSGQVLPESLTILQNGTNTPFPWKEVVAVSFGSNQPVTLRAEMKSGPDRRGSFVGEALAVHLGLGPELKLPIDLIARIAAAESGLRADSLDAPAFDAGHARENVLNWITNQSAWCLLEAGQFTMGSPTEEAGRDPDEGPQTRVVINQGFWMSKYEVTQAQFQSVMGANPSNTTGDPSRPVERVTWFEAVDFCKRLTELAESAGDLAKGYAYRLPTEAEWEYACRAGTTTRFSFGEDRNATQLGEYAWFTRNSESVTHPVGTRRPNPWGLYDMHGNVWEWCLDRWEDALPGGTVTNMAVLATGTLRTARGGSWLYEPKACRSANRDDYSPWDRCSDIGFRVVLAPIP